MIKYYMVTELEMAALMEISESMLSMSGEADPAFCEEANRGKKAIKAILKRAGKDDVKQNKTFTCPSKDIRF